LKFGGPWVEQQEKGEMKYFLVVSIARRNVFLSSKEFDVVGEWLSHN